VVLFLAVAGIIIFFVSYLNLELFTELELTLNETVYNDSEAYTQTTIFKEKNDSQIWDYAFLGLFFGCLIAIGLSAYAVRISPIFYWIYAVMALMVLVMGTILSNLWQELASEPDFASQLTNFPIMNTLLGSYYPLVVTVIVFFAMIILFGKPAGQQEGYS